MFGAALRGQSQRPSIIAASGGPVNEARQWCGRLIETVEVMARVTTHVIRREVAALGLRGRGFARRFLLIRRRWRLANHASTRTTQLYDRRRDEVNLDEVGRISI
jgi:integrase/recombinase XerD